MGSRRSFSGFTLVEIVVVLLIVAILIAMAAALTRGMAAAQKRSLTATRIAAVDTALMLYVQQQKRLPFPADGTKKSSDSGAGLESRPCLNPADQQNGVLPWRTLGITETDATDGWDRRLTYRVFAELTADGGMDMTGCDPAAANIAGPKSSTCAPACTTGTLGTCVHPKQFARDRGLKVLDLSSPQQTLMDPNNDPYTGAAYVVISAGESGGGAYLGSGNIAPSTRNDGTEERKNYANLPLGAYYLDNSIVEDDSGTGHFDDIVSRYTIIFVANKAGLGPRAH